MFLFDRFMFAIIPLFVTVTFILTFGVIVARLIKSAKEYKQNNNSPRLSVTAKVVAKRMNVHHHNNHTTSSSTYYVTFEVESGDRMEFKVEGSVYGMLVEQDMGVLHFQGTRYLNFERK